MAHLIDLKSIRFPKIGLNARNRPQMYCAVIRPQSTELASMYVHFRPILAKLIDR